MRYVVSERDGGNYKTVTVTTSIKRVDTIVSRWIKEWETRKKNPSQEEINKPEAVV